MMENKEIIELAYENDAIYVARGEGDYGSTEHDDIIKFAYAFLAKIDKERAAIAPPVAAGSVDTCAEMRALCSACGGTGDVHSIDGEWRGQCTCVHAWQQRAEKAEADLKARDFFVDVLNCQVKKAQGEADVLFHRLNAANGHLSMARERIDELEAEIKVLHQG